MGEANFFEILPYTGVRNRLDYASIGQGGVPIHLMSLGYVGVLFALFMEAIGVPFPSETILIASGVEMSRGVFHFVPLWLLATVGNVIGSNAAYMIGRFLGRPVVLRYGRFVRITESRLIAVETRFQRYQIAFLIIGKFIAFVRIVIPYLAGINKVSFWVFNILNTVAAIVWSALFILLGSTIDSVLKRFGGYFISHLYVTIPAILILVGLVFVYHRWSKKKMESGGNVVKTTSGAEEETSQDA